MDLNEWNQGLHPPTGSKRPSPAPSVGEDRETKKQRTQLCDNEDANRELLSREMPSSPVDFGGDDEVRGNQPGDATSYDIPYRDQFDISTGDNDECVSNVDGEFVTEDHDTRNDNHSQDPYQGCEDFLSTTVCSDVEFEGYWATLMQPGNQISAQDNVAEVEESSGSWLASSHNEANNAPSQSLVVQPQEESSDVCCDYDTCFGVVSQVFPNLHRRL